MRFFSPHFALLAFLGAAATACGGTIADPTGGTTLGSTAGDHAHPTPAPSATAPAPTATGVPTPPHPPSPPAECAAAKPTSSQPTPFPSTSDLRVALTRTWLHCGGSSPYTPAGPATNDGFQITQDGHFYALRRNAAGQLVRHTGFGAEGLVDILDTSRMNGAGIYQINFDHGEGGFNPTFAQFSVDESTLGFTDENGESTFIASSEDVIVPPLASGDGARMGAAGCAVEEGHTQTTYASRDDALAHVVGRWVVCTTTSEPGVSSFGPAGNVGIEIAADGHFYFLQASGSGYVRGDFGAENTGTWELIDTSTMNSAGTYQLNLTGGGGGTWIVLPAVSNAPLKLHFDNEGAQQVTYSALP